MKTKCLCCVVLMVAAGSATSHSGQLTTDNLDVLGTASFYGNVNIGWNDGVSLTNGLVLYYGFTTNSGGTVVDQSGNTNNGTVNGATWTTNGYSGGGYYFDGNDYISVGDILDLTGTLTNMTVCAWVKMPTLGTSEPHFVGKSTTSGALSGWELASRYTPNPFARITGNYGGEEFAATWNVQSEFQSNTWHLVCGTFRAEPSYLEASVYLDGILDDTGTRAGSYSSLNNTSPLTIGARDGGVIQFFTGYIDEVRIYNRILAANEIMALYGVTNRGALSVKDLIISNKLVQTGSGTNILMGPTGIGVTNPVGQLQVGGLLNVNGNIRLNNNWLSGDGDSEGVAVSSDGTVTINKLEKKGDISVGSFTNHP